MDSLRIMELEQAVEAAMERTESATANFELHKRDARLLFEYARTLALLSIAQSLKELTRLTDAVDDVYDVGTCLRVRQ